MKALDKESLKMMLCSMLPVFKIDVDKFLVGTQVKTLIVKQNKLVLATGGGFT